MLTRFGWFNFILLAVALAAASLPAGCSSLTPEEKAARKIQASYRLHLETNPDELGRTQVVPIYRKAPIDVCVDKSPFLDERTLGRASVIEVMGGFALQLELNQIGSHLLRNVTVSNRGRRIAVYSEVGTNNVVRSRWLAAPRIGSIITNGVFTFTPDATREELDTFVRGLENGVAARKKENRLFPMPE